MKLAKIYSLIFIPPLAQYVVTLEEVDGSRLIPIWIGVSEGTSIVMVLEGGKFKRPLTHDLTINLIKALGGSLEKVIISDLKDNAYYATIILRQGDKALEIDSRPSDAIALAVRTGAPVFIDEKVLGLCPVINKPISEDEVKNFEKEIESLRPEEFFKKLDAEGGKSKGGLE
ncbi:MAG: bifunctional nuclease family protein [Candidatus Omnitrophica bacterium]|nr:bifunctional nuclease family protein [Candidatus Omnitrophota bacterium]